MLLSSFSQQSLHVFECCPYLKNHGFEFWEFDAVMSIQPIQEKVKISRKQVLTTEYKQKKVRGN